jgi:hypothetical protein
MKAGDRVVVVNIEGLDRMAGGVGTVGTVLGYATASPDAVLAGVLRVRVDVSNAVWTISKSRLALL